MRSHFRVAVILFVSILAYSGCSHSTDPIDVQRKEARTYTWTIDTLFFTADPQYGGLTVIEGISGLNDSLVYAFGSDAWGGRGSMWNYNGIKWERVKLRDFEGGTLTQPYDIFALRGFAENNIYAFGVNYTNYTGSFVFTALALHYDGLQWKKVEIPHGEIIHSVTASTPNIMYCGGGNGQIFQFNGVSWSVDTIKISPYTNLPSEVSVIATAGDNGVYVRTYQYDPRGLEHFQFIHYKNKQITVIDSSTNIIPWGGYSYWQSDRGNLYSSGVGGVFRLSNNRWVNVFTNDVIYSIFGLKDDHMYAAGMNDIYFFDGRDLKIIFSAASNGLFRRARIWCSEKELFIAFNDNTKSYILHGK